MLLYIIQLNPINFMLGSLILNLFNISRNSWQVWKGKSMDLRETTWRIQCSMEISSVAGIDT